MINTTKDLKTVKEYIINDLKSDANTVKISGSSLLYNLYEGIDIEVHYNGVKDYVLSLNGDVVLKDNDIKKIISMLDGMVFKFRLNLLYLNSSEKDNK